MPDLTLPQIEALAELEKRATPAPWEQREDPLSRELVFIAAPGREPELVAVCDVDAELIAHSRNALPALLVSARSCLKLREELDTILAERDGAVSMGTQLERELAEERGRCFAAERLLTLLRADLAAERERRESAEELLTIRDGGTIGRCAWCDGKVGHHRFRCALGAYRVKYGKGW